MTRLLVEEILSRISTELPEIKKYGLFNDQFNKNDNGEVEQINFPAMFLSFPDELTYVANGSGVQKTDEFVIRFYIGMKFVNESGVLDIFDLKQKVFGIFNGWSATDIGTMTRIAEQTDEDRNNYYVFIQDYTANLIDTTDFIECNRVEANVNTLSISKDLIIDPNTVEGVRTDIITR
jgi:hypothetical protein